MIYAEIDSTTGRVLTIQQIPTRYKTETQTTTNADGTTTETTTQVVDDLFKPSWATNEFADDDADALKTLSNFQGYIYLNDTWSAYTPTSAEQLATAKNAQKRVIDQAYAGAELAGFASAADGTSRTYAFDPTAQRRWSWLREAVNAGTLPNPMTVKDFTGAAVSLTPTQAATLGTDAQNFWLTNYNKHGQLYAQIDAATTVVDVQTVTWS